jgi:hypothetical protein
LCGNIHSADHRKHCFKWFICCCMLIHCCGNLFVCERYRLTSLDATISNLNLC